MWRKGPPHVHTTEATQQQQQQHVHWLKCALVQPVWKTVWRFLKILKTEVLYTHTHTHTRNITQPLKSIKSCHLLQHEWSQRVFMLSEISYTEKDKYYIVSLIVESKKHKQMSKYSKIGTKSQIQRMNRWLPECCQRGRRQERNR